jgi:hypothetical protein
MIGICLLVRRGTGAARRLAPHQQTLREDASRALSETGCSLSRGDANHCGGYALAEKSQVHVAGQLDLPFKSKLRTIK